MLAYHDPGIILGVGNRKTIIIWSLLSKGAWSSRRNRQVDSAVGKCYYDRGSVRAQRRQY